MVSSICIFFFFKQKTAYEMRISDWSSDVCSSDLARPPHRRPQRHGEILGGFVDRIQLVATSGRRGAAKGPRRRLGTGDIGGVSVSPCHRTARVSRTSPLGPPLVIDGGLRFFGHSERGAMLERRRLPRIERFYDPFAINRTAKRRVRKKW